MTALDQLVVMPLRSYLCWTGKNSLLYSHLALEYHENSVALAKIFLKTILDEVDICGRIDTATERQRKQDCEKLVPIIKTIILYGREGIALRGLHDDGLFEFDPINSDKSITEQD